MSNRPDAANDEEFIPAATVVLIRDSDIGLELLMLERNPDISFGGMWVFPGGKVDPDDWSAVDADAEGSEREAARAAATRETIEEAGLSTAPATLIPHSHWLPPIKKGKRFSTWFFIAEAPPGSVTIDQGEITNHRWITPLEALRKRDMGRLELVPPTWVTLHRLSRAATVEAALAEASDREPPLFRTRIVRGPEALVAVWPPDPAHATGDLDLSGPYRRLVMSNSGWRWEGAPP